MIRYQLQCDKNHQFDGWFRDSAEYDAQAAAGEIACPQCGSTSVSKAIMAPNITPRSRHKGADGGRTPEAAASVSAAASGGASAATGAAATTGHKPQAPESGSSGAPDTGAPAPAGNAAGNAASNVSPAVIEEFQAEVVKLMRQVRREVEKKADYVGPRFAEEARKIHYEESEPRGIYGEASQEEVAELEDEGIEFMPLPKLPEDNN